MLVVTRKKDERLIIGNEIEIQVLRIGRDNVRLGIKAPSHISIYRYEIYEAIRNENVSAVKSQIPDKAMLTEIAENLRNEPRPDNPETEDSSADPTSPSTSEPEASETAQSETHREKSGNDASNGSSRSASTSGDAPTDRQAAPGFKAEPGNR